MSEVREAIFGSGASAVIVDGLFNSADLLFAFSEVVFTPLAVTFGTLAPNVDWLSQDALQPIMVFVAALYVSNLIIQRIQRFRNGDSDE